MWFWVVTIVIGCAAYQIIGKGRFKTFREAKEDLFSHSELIDGVIAEQEADGMSEIEIVWERCEKESDHRSNGYK